MTAWAVLPGSVGVVLAAVGVGTEFGTGYALITAGGLLIIDSLT